MAQSFKLTVIKNGQTHREDEDGDVMEMRPGMNLLEELEYYGFSTSGYQKLMVNGDLKEISTLKDFGVSGNITVEFVNKSEGGLKAA